MRAEAVNQTVQHILHQTADLQGIEHTADDQQKYDDGTYHPAAVCTQYQNGAQQPFHKGETAFTVCKSAVGINDGVACGIGHTGIFSCGDEKCQCIGGDHQHSDDGYGTQKGFDADIQTFFLFQKIPTPNRKECIYYTIYIYLWASRKWLQIL